MLTAENIKKELRLLADPARASVMAGFFKTGPGEYGEGDVFLGVSVPRQRALAKQCIKISFGEIERLLTGKIHEERLTAALILTYKFEKADEAEQLRIYNFYLSHKHHINNWDLVDVTCPKIVGAWLYNHDRSILYELVESDNLWERRMAVLACFYFIKRGETDDIFLIARKLLTDKHDLIHKAVGWMLREVGKNCSEDLLKAFLDINKEKMPRTMLRYAIERLKDEDKGEYLKKNG